MKQYIQPQAALIALHAEATMLPASAVAGQNDGFSNRKTTPNKGWSNWWQAEEAEDAQ